MAAAYWKHELDKLCTYEEYVLVATSLVLKMYTSSDIGRAAIKMPEVEFDGMAPFYFALFFSNVHQGITIKIQASCMPPAVHLAVVKGHLHVH